MFYIFFKGICLLFSIRYGCFCMTTQHGQLHPLTVITRELLVAFMNLGFEITIDPEIEEEWYNFTALNMLPNHPARDMQDSFWLKSKENGILRTQVSDSQIRFGEKHEPPFKAVYFGKVYRNEATDATHEAQFHQIECIAVGENVSIGHLKFTIETTMKSVLGDDIEYRLRPGHFPFTEPSLEVDVLFRGKWLEIAGAGMVHPNVLKNIGVNPDTHNGFAFAFGLDRMAMIRHNVTDIRNFPHPELRLHDSLLNRYINHPQSKTNS